MPIYEYKCQDCGQVTEVLQRSLQQDSEPVCAHCDGRNLEKMISRPAGMISKSPASPGQTCCGASERCSMPPCSEGDSCRRD